jgi:hypothetical protein
MSVVPHVIAWILQSRDLIIKKMIWSDMAILRIMLAILRLDTLFLMVITSVCDNLRDLLFYMFGSCNHVWIS